MAMENEEEVTEELQQFVLHLSPPCDKVLTKCKTMLEMQRVNQGE